MLTKRAVAARDCLNCGAPQGMTLQNVITALPTSNPLLYLCKRCDAQFTIPPPPLAFDPSPLRITRYS